jgi:hypothetical protein
MTEDGNYILFTQERTVEEARTQLTRFGRPPIHEVYGMAITLMCKLISYSNHFDVTRERALMPTDWNVVWDPRSGAEVLGNFTVNSKELDFLMQAVCFL